MVAGGSGAAAGLLAEAECRAAVRHLLEQTTSAESPSLLPTHFLSGVSAQLRPGLSRRHSDTVPYVSQDFPVTGRRGGSAGQQRHCEQTARADRSNEPTKVALHSDCIVLHSFLK